MAGSNTQFLSALRLFAAGAISAALSSAAPAQAQVFQVQGGSSSLYQAHGGSLLVQGRSYEGSVGLGYREGFQLGGSLLAAWRGTHFRFGDDAIPFRLPTDVFDSSHYFLVRGAGLSRSSERVQLFAFGGAISRAFGSPYFRGGSADTGVGLAFVDAQLRPKLRAFSRNLFTRQATSLHGLEWELKPEVRVSVTGGVGANQPYVAAGFSAERDWLTLKAAYVHGGRDFRRLHADTPVSAESDRENLLVTFRPRPFLAFTAGRQNFRQFPTREGAGFRGSINQFMAGARLARFTVNAALFQSQAPGSRGQGTSLAVGRNFGGRVQVDANWLRSRFSRGPSNSTTVVTVREALSPQLHLLQLITHSAGNTSVAFGGNFVSNRVSLGVEYQTLYVPFRGGSPFKQALVLNLRLQPFGNLQVQAGTYVAPDGSVGYSVSGSEIFYGGFAGGGAAVPVKLAIHKYVVRGRVVDPAGQPLRGAAVRVDGEVAYTDSRGEFLVRKRKPGPYALQVLVGEFLVPGQFDALTAPASVTAVLEDQAQAIEIVVGRRRPPQPETLAEKSSS